MTETGVNSLSVSLARSSLTNTASASGSTGYLNGLGLRVEVPSTITSVALLGINGKVKHPIVDPAGVTFSSSAIKAGAFVDLVFDASAKAWQSLSPSAFSGDLVNDTSPQLGGALDPNGQFIGRDKGGDIASASPLVIDTDGDYFDVTGTTNFAAMTVAANRHFFLQFDGVLTMTHHATNLDLPGEADITTAAGDVMECFSTGANTVQCVNYTRADGTPVVGSDVLGTEVATTSGATVEISTTIPSGTKKIFITFEGVSVSGTDLIEVQIGDSGGMETTGYLSSSMDVATASTSTSGFVMRTTNAAHTLNGVMTLVLKDSSDFTWCATHSIDRAGAAPMAGGGVKALTAELTQLQLATSGANTFDAGSVNIVYST